MVNLQEAFDEKKIVPYPDIIEGEIKENTFAVSFHAVINGTADKIYNDPHTFFNFTHMTNDLSGIISDVLNRVEYGTSRPLIVIDTTFGGGKTHSLVALHHLFRSSKAAENNDKINKILNEVGIQKVPDVSLVSIDCHNLSSVKKEGKARTIWGEIGKQLGNYDIIKPYDQENIRRPDADTINELLESTGKPVLIMIDELVNYLKDSTAEIVGDQNLAEITISFLHTITDVVSNSDSTMMVLTLPGAESAYKEESELMEKYRKKFKDLASREASFTVPMEKTEVYEVIKTRLFEKVDDRYARQVAEQLQQFYVENSEKFPEKVITPKYNSKIVKSYPFHPILIDVLYERISTIGEFQKTRGVLRLLAHVLKNIYYNKNDLGTDKIITPGLIDLNDNNIFQELTNKINKGEFQTVIKTDVVNEDSDGKCQEMDSKYRFGAKTRIATSIYLYSVIGTTKELSKGCKENELVLASAVKGITHPNDILNDLKEIENTLWYVWKKNSKIYFSVEVNINKVIYDERDRISRVEYNPEIKSRLRKMLKSDYFDVHIWNHDIRNLRKPTLAVVNFNEISSKKSEVPEKVRKIIEKEGKSFRTKKNWMYVLVPREDRIEKLKNNCKRYLAIKKLKENPRDETRSYSDKINELFKESDSNLNSSIELCYSLIYYPNKTDINSVTVLNGYEDAKNLPEKIYNALKEKANKIIENLEPVYIKDKILTNNNEISVNEIWENFVKSPAYPLPKNKTVVLNSIQNGVANKLFAIYTAALGDIVSLDRDNFEKVVDNFYYGRKVPGEPKDGFLLVPKKRAEGIDDKLNKIAESKTEKGGTEITTKVPTKKGEKPIEAERDISELTIENIDDVEDYIDWNINKIHIDFENVNIFNNIRSKLPILLLGISNIKFSIIVKSSKVNLIIDETEISDINEFMDVIYKISKMFKENLNVSLELICDEEFKIDSDISETIGDLSPLGDEIDFKAEIEK